MVDQAAIQRHVAYGLGIAARKLGAPFTVYRPTTALNPLQQPSLRTQLAAFQGTAAFPFTATSKVSKGETYGLFDTTDVQVGDIFVGGRTYFVAAFEPIEPALCLLANLSVTLLDTDEVVTVGANPYAGRTTKTDRVVASGWPACSVLKGRGDNPAAKTADDVRAGAYEMTMPPMPGVAITQGLRLTDQHANAYMIGGVEPLAYGAWKFLAYTAST